MTRPRLARHVRLSFDRTRQRHVLLLPETVVVLNATGAAVLGLCDGHRSVDDVVAALREFLARLADRRCVEVHGG